MTQRQVTEDDVRLPAFRGVSLDELEIRADGAVVRKDRWEKAIITIAHSLDISMRNFEIDDIVAKIDELLERERNRVPLSEDAIKDILCDLSISEHSATEYDLLATRRIEAAHRITASPEN